MIWLTRFFIQKEQLTGDLVQISGENVHRISRVLRLQPGDLIECVDQGERIYSVRIKKLGEDVLGQVVGTSLVSQESPLAITLFQALCKGDKMDWAVQKAVELGAAEIVPFSSQFTVVKLDLKQAKTRERRWQRIALQAAEQCQRTRLPVLAPLHTFEQLKESVKKRRLAGQLVLLAYEGTRDAGLGEVKARPEAVAVLIGPEGGFSKQEAAELVQAGARAFSLGPRILRTETAGVVALSVLGYKWGDLR